MSKSEIQAKYLEAKNPGALSSFSNFVKNNPFKDHSFVKESLNRIHAFSVHREPKRATTRRVVMSMHYSDLLAVDLADMNNINPHINKGTKFLMIIKELLSKMIYIYPLKNKKGKTVAEAFEKFFSDNPTIRNCKIWSDKGLEFRNVDCYAVLNKYGAKLYQTFNMKIKSSVAERAVKIVKKRLAIYMENIKSKKYIDILPDIQNSLNSEIKKSTGLRPIDVVNNENNESIAWYSQYRKIFEAEKTPPKLKINSYCRISQAKLLFSKSYSKSWSDEIFKITKIVPFHPIYVYQLTDIKSNLIIPTYFYDFELLETTKPE